MSQRWILKIIGGIALGGLILATASLFAPKAQGGQNEITDSRIQAGFSAAPVPLNMKGKNPALVGLGSYLVNVIGDCNGCHSAGPQTQFAPGHNPYFGQQEMVNPNTYLGGGRVFTLVPGAAPIISRNLTPDKTGLPEGGTSFEEFVSIMRTGKDPDNLHPTCSGAPNSSCIPPPFDGSLLQIMPWPAFSELTDHDLRAIYEYLSAVPCVQGNYPGEPTDRCQ
ncbi:MAG: cytochrome C [Terriglobia bacterium]|nr:cytochrome C [Terriglobia bacterium]